MSSTVRNFPRYKVIEILKPMYTHEGQDCVRINEKYIKEAIHNFQYLVIRTPNGEKTMMPKEVKKAGKKVKEVFLYKDDPMIMFELLIPHGELADMDKYRWG